MCGKKSSERERGGRGITTLNAFPNSGLFLAFDCCTISVSHPNQQHTTIEIDSSPTPEEKETANTHHLQGKPTWVYGEGKTPSIFRTTIPLSVLPAACCDDSQHTGFMFCLHFRLVLYSSPFSKFSGSSYLWNMIHWATATIESWESLRADNFARTVSSV